MKILITGGNGFIAKSLYKYLKHVYTVYCCSRANLDLLDTHKVELHLKKNKYDVVIHTANYDAIKKNSTKDPLKILNKNLRMFFNLTRCNTYFGKMIYFGSGSEFNRSNWSKNMTELHFDKYIPEDQYGYSKYVMSKFADQSNNIYNLRLFAVYGVNDDWRYRFISNICCHAALGDTINIQQNAEIDFLYINDLVRIVVRFINTDPIYKTYNVCSGQTYEFVNLANRLNKICNNNLVINVKNPGCRTTYGGNNSRLLKEINYKSTPMDKSILYMYKYYVKNKSFIDRSEFHY